MKKIRQVDIITEETKDDIELYKEFIILMKDILVEIKRGEMSQ